MANITTTLNNIFFGTAQSKYAAIAIFITIAVLCFFILFNSTDISFEQRFMVVFFLLLSAIPSILFALFELTCISARNSTKSVLCDYLAWFITFIIVIYCVLIMISIIMSMSNYSNAINRVNYIEDNGRVSNDDANQFAQKIMISDKSKMMMNHESSVPPMPPSMPPSMTPPMTPPEEPIMSPSMPPSMTPPMPPYSTEQPPNNSQVKSASIEKIPQAPLYKASNMPFAEATGYDSSDIYAPIKDTATISSDIPKIKPVPQVKPGSSSSEPEPFTNDDSLFKY